MDDQILTFVLLAVGFVLLGIELMIPSGGVIGMMCIASFLGSGWFAYQAWAETNPLYWRIYLTTFLIMIPVTLYGIYFLLMKTSFGNRILLVAPSQEEVTPYQREQEHLQAFLGRVGQAISPLRPGGLVQIDGERLHAIGDGFIIESGTAVQVVEIRGTRVVVQPHIAPPDSPPEATESEPGQRVEQSIATQETDTTEGQIDRPLNDIVDPFVDSEEG